MARWTFSDGSSSYVFPVNPKGGGSPTLKKRFHRDTPCNPATPDFVIRMEGRPEAPVSRIEGIVRTEAHWAALVTWWRTKPVITITDDVGRTFSVALTDMQIGSAYSPSAPWRSTYTMSYVILTPAVV